MKKYKITVAFLFILIGLSIILFPFCRGWYFDRIQAQFLDRWLASAPNEKLYSKQTSSDVESKDGTVMINNGVWIENTNQNFDTEYIRNHMEGVLSIKKINLYVPILSNATKKNLDISICSVENTGEMGQIGNYALAGHKSRIYGRQFNRLLELDKGDLIEVGDGIETYTYKVTEIFSVLPSEVWVLGSASENKMISLITCDYTANPPNRLIVRGEML